MFTNSTRNLDESMNDDALFVLEDSEPSYGLNRSATAGGRRDSGANNNTEDMRPSSVVMLRQTNQFDENGANVQGGDEKPSWWENTSHSQPKSCTEIIQALIHVSILVAVPLAILLGAYYSDNQILPYVYSFFVAFASYEFAWVAYRVRVHVFLPFKLYQKQTSRDIYTQIMAYSVDLQTCAVTPLAERFLSGHKVLSACLFGVLGGAISLVVCLLLSLELFPMAYIVMSIALLFICAALSPNLPDAVAMALRYVYFFVASLNVVLMLQQPAQAIERDHEVVGLNPFSLALIAVSLLLINRVLSSKEIMESMVQALLDMAGLLYISCVATVLNSFSLSPIVVFGKVSSSTGSNGDEETQSSSNYSVLLAFFVIVWSADLGRFLTEKFLKFIDFPWNHAIAKRVSSRQNVETLIGALAGGVIATLVVADYVDFRSNKNVVACLTAVAVVLSHATKLFLLSLKKIAKMSSSGSTLASVGGGVLDHMDTLLFMAVVFCPFFERHADV
uniref:Phosphatidate cytidylyltransferase n=1 Tax=Globisporangium ultimum (strain ATCC 200006 / CBS 805.95 / DAOM BR144) TaxID=431595 RepID=K3WSB5_GLOUD